MDFNDFYLYFMWKKINLWIWLKFTEFTSLWNLLLEFHLFETFINTIINNSPFIIIINSLFNSNTRNSPFIIIISNSLFNNHIRNSPFINSNSLFNNNIWNFLFNELSTRLNWRCLGFVCQKREGKCTDEKSFWFCEIEKNASSFALMMGNFSDGIDLGDVLRKIYFIVAKYRYLAGAKNTYVVQISHQGVSGNALAPIEFKVEGILITWSDGQLRNALFQIDFTEGGIVISLSKAHLEIAPFQLKNLSLILLYAVERKIHKARNCQFKWETEEDFTSP